jgi:glucose/arabinose dehydrogenase
MGGDMSRRHKLGGALAVLCLGSILAACAPSKPPPPPPRPSELPPPPPDQGPPANSPTLTTTTNFVTGLTNPWDMAFLPDGTMFFTERPGPVKVRLTSGTINTIVTPADVAPAGEAGMMGLAVDPGFASNRFIYACYTAGADNRVVRYRVNGSFNGLVGGGTALVQGLAKANFHDGVPCSLRTRRQALDHDR